ncbi:Brp/Blh family beta-carotene 15,15'-dioxygenase [Rhizosaccharibacter radicis]|uniref:Probable beta-carotene 15,15'-dioxygenase n=1 Tax=Rhizosaccharibacter radicis TaxID=2782605 RepID=A0ABT1VTJ6_9PROT|nr:Brp/Blh family beta-carotene 15,15'-dioxygenase [Acetobacteraceae bacterium KSS12]
MAIALTLLPGAWAQLGLLAMVIALGVPHGALDGEVARPLLRPRFGIAWFAVFSLPYLTLFALVLLCWRGAPLPTLAGFLLLSTLHFGEPEDGGRDSRWPVRLIAGGAPIALPVLLQPDRTAHLLGVVAGVALHRPPAWLLAGSIGWLGLLGATMAFRRSSLRPLMPLLPVLAALFLLLPPLAGFAAYFVGWHAPGHMRALVADPRSAPRVRTHAAAWWRSLPVTALTLLIGSGLWFLYRGPVPDRLLQLTLQMLAALTVPHMLLERLMQRPSIVRRIIDAA